MKYFEVLDNSQLCTVINLLPQYEGLGELNCFFCGFGVRKNTIKPIKITPKNIKLINAEFLSIVKKAKSNSICLQSCDILQYRGIFALLEILKKLKKHTILSTPGICLADKQLAQKISQYDISVEATFLTTNSEIYAKMTENKAAYKKTLAAIKNMRTLSIPYNVSIVVTKSNQNTIAKTVAFLKKEFNISELTVRLFFIDSLQKDRHFEAYCNNFPDFSIVQKELETINDNKKLAGLRVKLLHVPICQFDIKSLSNLSITLEYSNRSLDKNFAAICRNCIDQKRCPGIHNEYMNRYSIKKIDPKETNTIIKKLTHT